MMTLQLMMNAFVCTLIKKKAGRVFLKRNVIQNFLEVEAALDRCRDYLAPLSIRATNIPLHLNRPQRNAICRDWPAYLSIA